MADLIKQRTNLPSPSDTSKVSNTEGAPKKLFTNLSDLTSFHLQSNSVSPTSQTFSIPKLGSLPLFGKIEPNSSSTFVIPKLVQAQKSPQNYQLEKTLTPHEISMQKIMELKKIQISTEPKLNVPPKLMTTNTRTDEKQHIIDLSSAIRTENCPIVVAPAPIVNHSIDLIMATAITAPLPTITEVCEIDCSGVINFKTQKAKLISKFGKILCSKYRCKSMPYIKHEFMHLNSIKPFLFMTDSPDDKILKALKLK